MAYKEDIRIPLMVRGRGVPAGQTLEHMVLNNDFAPTFAKLAGEVGAPDFVDGRSLAPLLTDSPPDTANWWSTFLVEKWQTREGMPPYTAVRTQNHLYVQWRTGERELYDLGTDPYQVQSKHRTASLALKQNLASRLAALRSCAGAGCRTAEGVASGP